MKIKITAVFLLLVFILTACSKTPDTSSQNSNETESTYSEISDETSDETSNEPIKRTWPVVSGTFIQPYMPANYSEEQWKTHYKNLLEVGIDTMIIQWIAETPYGKFKTCYYDSNLVENNKTSDFSQSKAMLERCLKTAEELGVKVFVGLNLSDEWWNKACTDTAWNKTQADLGVAIAEETYLLYKEKYPNAFYGWYFAWEMFNGMQNYEKQAGEFLNMFLDPLTELDASMPFLLSPFVSKNTPAEKTGQEWKKVFEYANFREGDIFCCQDSVGAGHIEIDQLDAYFAELKKACDTETGLRFWANTENFDQSTWTSAYIDRFVRQMKIAQPYVEGYVTFSYSHYYSKDVTGKAPYHNAYKVYYDTGMETAFDLEKPTVALVQKNNETYLSITLKNSPAGMEYIKITSPVTKTISPNALQNTNEELSFEIKYTPDSSEKNCVVELKDYFGNVNSFTIPIN
ncbi:DUF4434 domain-containing protein [Eubacteriales bacterium OttesenSCG-928-G02]|nr:DUF4434 domain-containing protein [Eubacteriales bacterium OttesenSCG-928-G02]